MQKDAKLIPAFNLLLSSGRGDVDQIDAILLYGILTEHSIASAAQKAGISYRNAWDRLKRLESDFGRKVVKTKKGGKEKGGAELTEFGRQVLHEYRRLNTYLFNALQDRDFWPHISFKLSARNRLKSIVEKVIRGDVTSEIKLRVKGENQLTSIITNEAIDDLGLKEGDAVYAIIKATEVIIAKEKV